MGYRDPEIRRDFSENIPLRIGSPAELWNKVMKEVKEHRYVGPYESPPFENFIQSPIGLVPKANKKTRLIFHLSYDFGKDPEQKSFNFHTPDELCSVRYNELDHVVRTCLKLIDKAKEMGIMRPQIFFGKSDLSNAFRLAPTLIRHRNWLMMKARHPIAKKIFFIVDLCIPFGASISCAIFQAFSDSLKHIMEWVLKEQALTKCSYDFLFMVLLQQHCNFMMIKFLRICRTIGCRVSMEKTEWACKWVIFLGVLLDGSLMIVSLPEDKCVKALTQIRWAIRKRKITVKFIQSLTETLNFLSRAIIPGCTFTRMMYTKFKRKNGVKYSMLKQHHHIWLDSDFVKDCLVWEWFLGNLEQNKAILCCLFVDFGIGTSAKILNFYSNASLNPNLGMGAVYREK